jgi:hypothetical protein
MKEGRRIKEEGRWVIVTGIAVTGKKTVNIFSFYSFFPL